MEGRDNENKPKRCQMGRSICTQGKTHEYPYPCVMSMGTDRYEYFTLPHTFCLELLESGRNPGTW